MRSIKRQEMYCRNYVNLILHNADSAKSSAEMRKYERKNKSCRVGGMPPV